MNLLPLLLVLHTHKPYRIPSCRYSLHALTVRQRWVERMNRAHPWQIVQRSKPHKRKRGKR